MIRGRSSYLAKARLLGLGVYLLIFLIFTINPAKSDEQEFVISYHSMPTTLDPQKAFFSANIALANQLYDSLFVITDESQPKSLIVDSWEVKNDTTWIFHLKPNIYFHDGTLLTAKDVLYSFNRIKNIDDLEYKTFAKRWKSYEALDDYTIKLETQEPYSSLLRNLGNIYILKAHDTLVPHEQFMEQKGYIGSGPYRLDSITSDGDIHLIASEHYHGDKVFLKRVMITRIADIAERARALDEGRIQLAEGLGEFDPEQLAKLKNVSVIKAPTHRLFHLHLDFNEGSSPFVKSYEGKVINNNPLHNVLVRKAISLAIDRNYLVNELLKGNALIANQFMLPNVGGYLSGFKADSYNPEMAKHLLQESGYDRGFELVLHGTNDRYVNDQLVLSSLAKMLTDVGIKTKAIALNRKEFFHDLKLHQYSAALVGFTSNGNIQGFLDELIHSVSESRGLFNFGSYSNPEVDNLIHMASEQFNQVKKLRSLNQATEIALNDYALIPLYFEQAVWGVHRNDEWEYWPSQLNGTIAQDVKAK